MTEHFLSREDIENRALNPVSDLFRTVPGARVIHGAFGREDIIRLRGGCPPVVVLDGIVMANPVRIDELFPVMGVEGNDLGLPSLVQVHGNHHGVLVHIHPDPDYLRRHGAGPPGGCDCCIACGSGALPDRLTLIHANSIRLGQPFPYLLEG